MQLGLHGPEAPQLTTSDLLRLLAADGAPFADVAAAVVHRFGGDANSSVWLARTLVTLLRVRGAPCLGSWLGGVQASSGAAWWVLGATEVANLLPTLPTQPPPAPCTHPLTPGRPAVHRGRKDERRIPAALCGA